MAVQTGIAWVRRFSQVRDCNTAVHGANGFVCCATAIIECMNREFQVIGRRESRGFECNGVQNSSERGVVDILIVHRDWNGLRRNCMRRKKRVVRDGKSEVFSSLCKMCLLR